jgi:hypothetical protein
MARCLLGVFVVTAGLVALASMTRGNFTAHPQTPAPTTGGTRLREMEVSATPGSNRTMFRVLPALNLSFSLN